MFGYIYQNKQRWFTDCMEAKKDHFNFKNEMIDNFIESSFCCYLKSFSYQTSDDVLNYFLSNENKFLKYPEHRSQSVYLDNNKCSEIYSKLSLVEEEIFISPYLSHSTFQHYFSEIALVIKNNVAEIYTSEDINIYQCADPFVFVFNFNRGTFDVYFYKKYSNFVLDQDFYDIQNKNYHPTLVLRLNFDDIFITEYNNDIYSKLISEVLMSAQH